MVKTVSWSADIPANRELHLRLPADIPSGPADLQLVVSTEASPSSKTLGDLLDSEYTGMWADRRDIADSTVFASQLRDQGWKRSL